MDKARLKMFYEQAVEDSLATHIVQSKPVFENVFVPLTHADNNDAPTLAVATCFQVDDQDGTRSNRVMVAFDGQQLYLSSDEDDMLRSVKPEQIDAVMAIAVVESGLTSAQTDVLYKELSDSAESLATLGSDVYGTGSAGDMAVSRAVGAVLEDQGTVLWDRMEKGFKERMTDLMSRQQGLSKDDVDVQLAKDIRDLAFGTPILIEGERGVGKTFEAKMFAKKNGFNMVVAGGHDGIESADLLGHYVAGRDEKGQSVMFWKDGPVTEAFRAASEGKSTVLVLDELLRIPQRQLNVLLTALSADETDTFELRTGKMAGDNKEEVLRAPQSKLAVIGTTNVGMEYAVDEIDPALMDRFTTVYKETTLDDVKKILHSAAKQAGLPKEDAERATKFWSITRNLEQRGTIKSAPSVRTLCMALKLAPRKDLQWALNTQAGKMVARDSNGAPLAAELAEVKKCIEAAFAPEKTKARGASR